MRLDISDINKNDIVQKIHITMAQFARKWFHLIKHIKSYCRCFIIEYYQITLFLDIGDEVSIIDDDITGESNENTTES